MIAPRLIRSLLQRYPSPSFSFVAGAPISIRPSIRMSSTTASKAPRILIYLLRHDLRVSDNPIFHEIARVSSQSSPSFTHILPIYVFPANQIEISGFLKSKDSISPYPEARGRNSGFWRCNHHRIKFISQSVWDVQNTLESMGSGLALRVGMFKDVINDALQYYAKGSGDDSNQKGEVVGVWMTADQGTEEKSQERVVEKMAEKHGVEFKLWADEKYFVDHRDLPFDVAKMSDLPDVYTTFRKSVEPLRDQPRKPLPRPEKLPPIPPSIPPQFEPFTIPETYSTLLDALHAPLNEKPDVPNLPSWPSGTKSAHPFSGGETNAQKRLHYLLKSGSATAYKDTRNGLIGEDFSTKLSGYLSQGCMSARQIHAAMLDFEDGKIPRMALANAVPEEDETTSSEWSSVPGYGGGENKGTAAIRFELLWRDYMRLCAQKFNSALFTIYGFHGAKNGQTNPEGGSPERPANPQTKKVWHYLNRGGPNSSPEITRRKLIRFIRGETGIGLVDASQRELLLTGYTSNRARQNVASFLSSHLNIDWRLGAEWYEAMLVDYDVGSNWGNWQYVAGVGNDPRLGRVFNPVKQALDYDGRGEYVRAWVEELRGVDIAADPGSQQASQQKDEKKEQQSKQEPASVDPEKLMGVFQAWRLGDSEKAKLGLKNVEWVEYPLTKINFSVSGKGRNSSSRGGPNRSWGRGGGGRGGRGRGGRDRASAAAQRRGGFPGGGGGGSRSE